MKNKLAVILDLVEDASRLAPLTDHRPLASLPFDGRYRLIDFPFSSMFNAELISAALFISESGQSLYDHIRSGSVWGLDSDIGGGVFTYSHIEYKLFSQENEAEKHRYYENHRTYIERSHSNEVLIAGSQILANVNLRDLKRYHQSNDHKVTAVYKNYETSQLAEDTNVKSYQLEDGLVKAMHPAAESSDESIAAGAKMAVIDTDYMMDYLDWAEENNEQVSAESIIQYALDQQEDVSAYEYTAYFASIEDIPTYFQASMDMLEDPDFHNLFFKNGKIITRPHDGAPTYFGSQSEVNHSHLASNCQINGKVSHSVLFRNIDVAQDSVIENAVLMSNTKVGQGAKIQYAILDKNVEVEAGVSIQGSPDNIIVIKKGSKISEDM